MSMHDNRGSFYLARFRFVALALSCHIWSLSCLLEKVSRGPPQLLELLNNGVARLRILSSLLLEIRPTEGRGYANAAFNLERCFILFRSVYALYFVLNDYSGTGENGRNNSTCVLVDRDRELEPHGDAARELMESLFSTCERKILDVFYGSEHSSYGLSDSNPLIINLWVSDLQLFLSLTPLQKITVEH
jgi:hypothetical protein